MIAIFIQQYKQIKKYLKFVTVIVIVIPQHLVASDRSLFMYVHTYIQFSS
jgi:hypothetical protein